MLDIEKIKNLNRIAYPKVRKETKLNVFYLKFDIDLEQNTIKLKDFYVNYNRYKIESLYLL